MHTEFANQSVHTGPDILRNVWLEFIERKNLHNCMQFYHRDSLSKILNSLICWMRTISDCLIYISNEMYCKFTFYISHQTGLQRTFILLNSASKVLLVHKFPGMPKWEFLQGYSCQISLIKMNLFID